MYSLPILISIALLVVTVFLFIYLYRKLKQWGFALLLLLAFWIPFLSHVWHAVSGEAFIAEECDVNKYAPLGWVECVDEADVYTLLFNSYEITVAAETIILYSIGLYLVLDKPIFQKRLKQGIDIRYIVVILLSFGIVSATGLFLIPYIEMIWYEYAFNYANILILIICLILLHPLIETPLAKEEFNPLKNDDDDNMPSGRLELRWRQR